MTSPIYCDSVGVSKKMIHDQTILSTGSPTNAIATIPVLKYLKELFIKV